MHLDAVDSEKTLNGHGHLQGTRQQARSTEPTWARRKWVERTADGKKTEYFYNQTPGLCWASRKTGDHLETCNPAKRGLTRKQIEALFHDPS